MKSNLKTKIAEFNPNECGSLYHGIFGLPFNVEESKVVLVPIPWEATVSYEEGTAMGPKAILEASQQIDLYDPINPDGWKAGIAMHEIPSDIFRKSQEVREKVLEYLKKYNIRELDRELQNAINTECFELKNYVKAVTTKCLNENKLIGIIGGDHSVPLGYLETLSEKYRDFGVLHIDAHADLRNAYQGLEYSHASIFFNALKIKNISKVVQIGIRDFCEEECELIKREKNRIALFTDYEIKKELFYGKTWKVIADEIISELPENVYISFDIDGLLPYLCPNTGTPVAGGFAIEELTFLFEEMISSGRKIIGFDLCEVAPGENEWDGNVGARVLYKLCLLALKSQVKLNTCSPS